ncbi:hypothetical protein ABZ770_32900 [Streptomyces sp. NPDC006654]|uniref:MmyB family transcriptional regulator n=1 Tax=unclassified Streptomyces TaxID=2593676 RepID=UPI0033F51BA1
MAASRPRRDCAARRSRCSPGAAPTTTQLSTRSEVFRSLRAAHNVRLHHCDLKRFRHPAVGDLTLAF